MIHLLDMVIDSQHPLMLEKPNSSKVLSMSKRAFDGYTNQMRWMFPKEVVEERFSYRMIDIEVFESDEIYISISMKNQHDSIHP